MKLLKCEKGKCLVLFKFLDWFWQEISTRRHICETEEQPIHVSTLYCANRGSVVTKILTKSLEMWILHEISGNVFTEPFGIDSNWRRRSDRENRPKLSAVLAREEPDCRLYRLRNQLCCRRPNRLTMESNPHRWPCATWVSVPNSTHWTLSGWLRRMVNVSYACSRRENATFMQRINRTFWHGPKSYCREWRDILPCAEWHVSIRRSCPETESQPSISTEEILDLVAEINILNVLFPGNMW